MNIMTIHKLKPKDGGYTYQIDSSSKTIQSKAPLWGSKGDLMEMSGFLETVTQSLDLSLSKPVSLALTMATLMRTESGIGIVINLDKLSSIVEATSTADRMATLMDDCETYGEVKAAYLLGIVLDSFKIHPLLNPVSPMRDITPK